jgi:hypothetical protein
MRGAHLQGGGALHLDGVDGDDVRRSRQRGTLHRHDPQTADAHDDDRLAGRRLNAVHRRAPAGPHRAAEQARLIQWDIHADLHRGVDRYHRLLHPGRDAAHLTHRATVGSVHPVTIRFVEPPADHGVRTLVT